MLSSFMKIVGFVVSLFLLASVAIGAEIKADNYDIYLGDLNDDGGSDFYFHRKPVLVILHGDIATPIFAPQPNSFVVYRNGAEYTAPQLLTLTDAQLSQKLTLGSLRIASSPTDFSIWGSAVVGESYILLRGADIAAPALLLRSSATAALPVFQKNYSVANYAGISDPNVPLRAEDINNDGFIDIVLGSFNSSSGETAYLAAADGVPTTAYEVTPASTPPSVAMNNDDGIAYHVGTVGGEFRVDESGAATYTIPIQLPQGTAGVTPQVSLNYSSGSGIGILGKGWALNAFSSISRCRQTLSQDLAAKPITWSAQDRFCLDGQRLILVSGSYGAANSTYKTEMDSLTTITAVGAIFGGTGYFSSIAKDGSTTFYGRTINSKFYNLAAGEAKTLTWAQSRFQDNVGNGIDYVYDEDSSTGLRLKNIYYAYGSVSLAPTSIPQTGTGKAVITFNYENRPDHSFVFVAGYEFKQTQRLYQVLVQNDSKEIRRYNLGYMSSTTTGTRYDNNVSRLERIRECVGPSNCLVPTTFMWGGGSHLDLSQAGNSVVFENASSGKYLLNHFFANLTGNGKQDLVYLMFESGTATSATLSVRVKYADTALSSTIYFYNKDYSKFNITSLDYNADGRQDLAIYDNTKWQIYLSTPNSDNTWKINSSSTQIDPGLTDKDTSFIDINSDGLADTVTASSYRLLARNAEPNTSNKAYSFGGATSFSWGAASNYPGTEEPLAGPYNCVDISYKQKLIPTKAADFNGDGVVDFIGDYIKTGTCSVSGAPTPQVISRAYTYALFVSGNSVSNYGNIRLIGTDITPVDINGDGLSDITYRVGNDIFYMMNNGAGFNAAVLWVTLPSYSSGPKAALQYLDVNGDGSTDIVWANRNTGKLNARLWGGTTDIEVRTTISTGQNDSHLLMDVSGDGILDYLRITSTALTGYKGTLATVGAPIPCYYISTPAGMQCVGGVPNPSIPVPENEQHTNIYSIDNGLGNVTKVGYGTLSNSGRYSTTELNLTVTTETLPTGCPQNMGYPCAPTYTSTVTNAGDFYSRLNGGWVLPEGSITLVTNNATKGAPVLEVNGAMPVVTSVESSAPVAGSTPNNVNTNGMSKVDYYYSEAKLQASGRGFLGFNTLKTIDAQTGITTITTYRQDFPFIGSPLSTVVYKTNAPNALLLSKSINTLDFKQFTGTDNTKYYQTKIKKGEEQAYDYGDSALLQTVTVENTSDDFGNLTYSKTVTEGKKADGVTNTKLTKEISNVYGATDEYRKFGRLTSATVTTMRDTEPQSSRTSTFTYYGAGDSKGAQYLLKTETVSSGLLPTTTTTYEYDGFGNKNKISTSASDSSEVRNVIQNYGSTGRYLVSTTNDLNQSSTINERDEFGNIKAATDTNLRQSTIVYDAMGSEYLRKDGIGGWARVETQFCGTVTCPGGAKYRVYKRVAGGGKSYEYFDLLGRVIRATKIGFDGTQIHVDTEYDNLSRVKRQSVPFAGTTAQYWTENTYDHLGRVISVKAPDGSESTSNYLGNTTTLTNSLGQQRTEIRNGLGQLEKVKDQLEGTVEYEYDLYGNLAKAKTTADGVVTVQICYDVFGRKVAMHDPDKGGFVGNANLTCSQVVGANPKKSGWWYYSYNAFGELIEQSDPKGQKTKNYYDQLGRIIGRTDYLASNTIESFSQWFYEGGVGEHNPSINGKLTAVIMNSASGLTTAQVESAINDKAVSCNQTDSSCHTTLYDFNVYGLPVTSTIYYPGSDKAYIATTKYDTFGRVYLQHDALDGVILDANGKLLESGIQTHYNLNGYAYKTTDIATGKLLQMTQGTNVLGQVTQEVRGNGLVSTNTYDVRTGLLTNQKTLSALNLPANIQNNNYGWDTVGNLKYRQNLSGKSGTPAATGSSVDTYAQAESFCYDGLNRLIKTIPGTTGTGGCSNLSSANQDVRYDGHGNIKYKKDGVGGVYTYGSNAVAGPHAAISAGNTNYFYDNNGNVISSFLAGVSTAERTLEYTSYDMVKKIQKGSSITEFQYGADRSRWQRKDTRSGAVTTTTYMGNVERIQTTVGTIEWKRNVAGTVITYRTDSNNNLQATDKRYIYTDHLGSVDLITDANGEVQGQFSKVSHAMSFDAWGARRNITQWDAQTFALLLSDITVSGFNRPITRRGFTGHEMVDDMGIIHMNGRIYDPKIARFLQADPFIQAAMNTQSFNRYSYVLNNPLNATDPSGYFSLSKFISKHYGHHIRTNGVWATHWFLNKTTPKLAPVIQTGLNFIPAIGWIISAAFGANNAFYVSGERIQAGVRPFVSSVASSYVFSQIGQQFNGVGIWAKNGAGHILAHAVAGGTLSVLQGGKFGHGFAAAGIAKGIDGKINFGSSPSAIAAETAIIATIGGTVSEMTGGKFANGAMTAAFAHIFNEMKSYAAEQKARMAAWRAKHPVPSMGDVWAEEGWDVLREWGTESGSVAGEMSRISGHAAGAAFVSGQLQFAIPLSWFSTAAGGVSVAMEAIYGSPYKAADSAGGLVLEQGFSMVRDNLPPMLPAPAKAPLTLALTIADRASQEILYQAGKN